MKQRNIKLLLALLISMLSTEASADDIALKNGDGNIIFYNYINDSSFASS